MNRPAVELEFRDLDAAAKLLDALRGRPPHTERAARTRSRLAEALTPVRLAALAHTAKDTDAHTP